ncbi:hypothetical protein ABZ667_43545 [Streptomyces lavendulae]|uniref:hypothetical protein n=1 Tax=Streptomyces lavendulae TaxID=1914 RepID=UPI0033C78A4E
MPGLRNLAIGVHRQDGRANIAAALRHTAHGHHRPLSASDPPGNEPGHTTFKQ